MIVFLSILNFTAARADQDADQSEIRNPQSEIADTVLSVRTEDGLVVLHGARSLMGEVRAALSQELGAGAANSDVLRLVYPRWTEAQVRATAYTAQASAGDTGERPRPAETLETTVADAVGRGLAPMIINLSMEDAYMLVRMWGDSMLILDEPPPQSSGVARTIFVYSSTWNIGRFGIFIDGASALPDTPPDSGYTFAALDPRADAVFATGEFHTFANMESGASMQSFLEGLPADTLLLGAVNGGPGVFITGGAVNALRAFGSANDPNPEILSSHAIVGRKGLPPGGAFEAFAINMPSHVALFADNIYVSSDSPPAPPAAGRRFIAISGTAPADKIIIIE